MADAEQAAQPDAGQPALLLTGAPPPQWYGGDPAVQDEFEDYPMDQDGGKDLMGRRPRVRELTAPGGAPLA